MAWVALRDRVRTAGTPRVAPPNAPQGQPATCQGAMPFDGLQGIGRATRRKPALDLRSEYEQLRWRDYPAVKPHAKDQNVLGCVHFTFFNKPAFRSVVKRSRSTVPNPLSVMEARATRTSSTGWASSCWCRRKRQHGFLNRNASKSGRATLRNRRRVGRKRLTPV